MESATEKQVIALKKFAKNPLLSKGLLKGVQFEDLNRKEASELITKCYGQNGNGLGEGEYKIKYSQNFKDTYGIFRVATLTDEELTKVREVHNKHCREILNECKDEYPGDPEIQIAVFEKRCDKIFTWIQHALDEKIRQHRGNFQQKS